MPSSAAELTTVTVCSPTSVVSCSSGCKPPRTPLPVLSLGQKISTVTPILHQLHWLSIQQHIWFKITVLVYKCQHNMARSYLSTYCIPTSSHDGRCHLRSAISGQLSVPRTTMNCDDRSFAVSSPVMWNSLPAAFRLNMSVFRRQL